MDRQTLGPTRLYEPFLLTVPTEEVARWQYEIVLIIFPLNLQTITITLDIVKWKGGVGYSQAHPSAKQYYRCRTADGFWRRMRSRCTWSVCVFGLYRYVSRSRPLRWRIVPMTGFVTVRGSSCRTSRGWAVATLLGAGGARPADSGNASHHIISVQFHNTKMHISYSLSQWFSTWVPWQKTKKGHN